MLMYRWIVNLEVINYSNSDFVGCVDSRKSTTGYIFVFFDRSVSWRSVKKSLIAAFTMEADFVSCSKVTSHLV